MLAQFTPAPLTMTIPLTRGYEAIIDATDYELVAPYRWAALVAKQGKYIYAITSVRGTGVWVNRKPVVRPDTLLMHRLILGLAPGVGVGDHINGNTLDNRRSNLRVVDNAGNARNNNLARVREENGRLKALLEEHGIAW